MVILIDAQNYKAVGDFNKMKDLFIIFSDNHL